MNLSNTASASEQMGLEEFNGGTVVACVILSLSFLVGAPGNLLVIWTILRHIKSRSHTVVLILHLAVADLLVLITLPLWIYSLAFSWVFGEAFCKAVMYIISAGMYSSIFLITFLGVERFVAIRYPFTSVKWQRQKAFYIILMALWISACLFSIPIIQTQVVGETSEETLEEPCFDQEYTPTQELVSVLLQTLVGYVLPFSVLVVCYSCLCSRLTQMSFKSKRKSTVLITSIVIVFAICWTPHHIGNILTLIVLATEDSHPNMAEHLESIRTTMVFIAGAMVFISSSVNPVLYLFAARSFRESMRETGFQKLFQHLCSTSRGESNKESPFRSTHHGRETKSSECVSESRDKTVTLLKMHEMNES